MVALVEAAGARSLLCIPMLKEENVIGAIAVYQHRQKVSQADLAAMAGDCA
jgi:GAF domain-containing protein